MILKSAIWMSTGRPTLTTARVCLDRLATTAEEVLAIDRPPPRAKRPGGRTLSSGNVGSALMI